MLGEVGVGNHLLQLLVGDKQEVVFALHPNPAFNVVEPRAELHCGQRGGGVRARQQAPPPWAAPQGPGQPPWPLPAGCLPPAPLIWCPGSLSLSLCLHLSLHLFLSLSLSLP